MWVHSQVGELRSCMLCNAAKRKNKYRSYFKNIYCQNMLTTKLQCVKNTKSVKCNEIQNEIQLYCLLDVCRVYSNLSSFIPPVGNLCLLCFFFLFLVILVRILLLLLIRIEDFLLQLSLLHISPTLFSNQSHIFWFVFFLLAPPCSMRDLSFPT